MQSKATTVAAYLAELPPDRRTAIAAVRKVILDNLDSDYEEGMSYGMIGYYVPHRVYPAGYHCNPSQPVPFVCLASQKGHMSLYMMGLYCGCIEGGEDNGHRDWFINAVARSGKKLDMGKACIRFKRVDALPLDVIGEAVRRLPAKKMIELYERSLEAAGTGTSRKPATKQNTVAKKSVTKKVATKGARATNSKTSQVKSKKRASAR